MIGLLTTLVFAPSSPRYVLFGIFRACGRQDVSCCASLAAKRQPGVKASLSVRLEWV